MRSVLLVPVVLASLSLGCAARPTPEAAAPPPVVVETTPEKATSNEDAAKDRAQRDREIAENAGILALLQEQQGDVASIFATSGLTDDEVSALGGLIGDGVGEAFGPGGLGLAGTGQGGGGTGEGTIGLGSIGTIGHGGGGSGFGTGVGRLGGSRSSRPPRVRMGATTVSSGLPPEIVQRVVRQHFGSLRACYEKSLAADPKLEGRLVVDFVIASDGSVSSASASESTGEQQLDDCAVKELESMTFPAPKGGVEVKVKYPIVFMPGDQAASGNKTKAAPAPPATK